MAVIFPVELEPGADMLARLRQMTDDEFFYFCQENPDYKFERDTTGTINIMAQTGGETGRKNAKLTARLVVWADDTGAGEVFDSSTGFRLPNGAMRGPDTAFVVAERWNNLSPAEQAKFPPLCPDFVVELMSESDSVKTTDVKMREYIDNGCRLGWLIDPRTEEARIYRADGSISIVHGFDKVLPGEDVLPGFSFSLSLLC
jgi:Uma2 family endonuclease